MVWNYMSSLGMHGELFLYKQDYGLIKAVVVVALAKI